MNKLIEELSTAALAEFDAEIRFRARAALGSPEKALRIIDKAGSARSGGPAIHAAGRSR